MAMIPDCARIRGVNYYPFPSDEARLRKELSYGSRVGLNALRVWLDFGAWEHHGDAYLSRLKDSVRIAYDCGYNTMPILFNGNGRNSASLPDEKRPAMMQYVRETVSALRDEPGLLMWDAMNEPHCCGWIDGCADPAEKAARRERVWELLRTAIPVIRECDPVRAVTVGYTTAWETEDSVCSLCDVYSFHDYSATRSGMESNFSRAAEWGKKYGIPVIQSETGCLARANPYDMVLKACSDHGFGWFIYELMIHDRCDSEHGVFYPDGTVRDPATVSAMMGCFRCRDLDMIVVPVPNREGHAAHAVENIRKALTEYTDDAFDYRPSDLEALYEAAEFAANLLEGCDMIPMAVPPTARIAAWRKQTAEGNKPPLAEVRAFAYELALRLKEICQLL